MDSQAFFAVFEHSLSKIMASQTQKHKNGTILATRFCKKTRGRNTAKKHDFEGGLESFV
jgi:hypothetical protein